VSGELSRVASRLLLIDRRQRVDDLYRFQAEGDDLPVGLKGRGFSRAARSLSPIVILSGAIGSRSEPIAESKDLAFVCCFSWPCGAFLPRTDGTEVCAENSSPGPCWAPENKGSLDCTGRFASEPSSSARDDRVGVMPMNGMRGSSR
jgi:hypothetical protein